MVGLIVYYFRKLNLPRFKYDFKLEDEKFTKKNEF